MSEINKSSIPSTMSTSQLLSPRFLDNNSLSENGLHYLLIINKDNEPLFFKAYRTSVDDLNIQLHCYASLDFLDEKWI